MAKKKKKATSRSSKTPSDYRSKLKIDREALDDELIMQPQLVFEVGRACALALSLRDQDKSDLKRLLVSTAAGLRAAGSAATVANAEAVTDAAYMSAEAGLRIRDKRLDEWEALKEAVKAKGYALRELVELHATGHFETGTVRSTADRARGR